MAKATVIGPPRVEMELSVEEAETLRRIFYYIGGSQASRRALVDAMNRALIEAGIDMGPMDIAPEPTPNIYFR